ncbi:MAG TPA: efflux transporter outer membrane subunit [Opitutaceae bacterium]|jgi:multidrug efflux system outer membrane protein|nr:efflux transporter outer membrane subunit [Opitutaceae bacterium]
MHRSKSTSAVLAFSFLLAGCAIGPNYKRPAVTAPAAFRDEAEAGNRSFADLAWWDVYRDEQLKALIRAALAEGYDARIAAARVEQARAIAAQVRGQFFPGIGYEANADRGRNALLGNPNPQGTGARANGFDGYLSAAWEFDLWGRVRRLNEEARSQYLASEEGRRGVLLSLVSQVATSYFELLELDEELAIAHDETQSFDDSLKLFNQRLEGGIASRLETSSAEAAKAMSAARVPEIERQIAITENQLSVLLGHNPGPIIRGARLLDQVLPPEVPAGLPSQLLERRPDILQVEASARAANAGIGVTIGGFLPRIGLSALFGAVSPQLDDITSRKAGLWSVGAQATGPLFQGGGLRGEYRAAKEAWEEARLEYQQTALNAFAEVADALVSRQKLAQVRQEQEHAVHAYQEAVTIAKQRYASGNAGYYEVLQAQQQLFPAEVALAQTRRDELATLVQLYKALGGGWNLKDAAAWAGPK